MRVGISIESEKRRCQGERLGLHVEGEVAGVNLPAVVEL
jgi:hypothetical protein